LGGWRRKRPPKSAGGPEQKGSTREGLANFYATRKDLGIKAEGGTGRQETLGKYSMKVLPTVEGTLLPTETLPHEEKPGFQPQVDCSKQQNLREEAGLIIKGVALRVKG